MNQFWFWAWQFVAVMFWLVLALINIITLSMFWTALSVFGFLLSSINLYFYFKCRGGTLVSIVEHQKKIRSFAEKVGLGFITQSP